MSDSDEVADLERLADGLGPCGCKTVLVTQDGSVPTLDIVNGREPSLSGRVQVSAGHFRWSGAEPIARRDQLPVAIEAIARTVRACGARP